MSASTSGPSSSPERAVAAESVAALALEAVAGVGPARHRALMLRHGDFATALDAVAGADAPRLWHDAARVLREAAARGLGLLHPGDPDYPPALLDLGDPPATLWTRGSLAALPAPLVAIVGTRRCSAYGERVTRDLATALARAGVGIVSGMARGIDAVAHLAALDAGGRTIAVLGTGADVAYPPAHRDLHERIAECGLVLSEAPPGHRGGPGAFPRRNRIIAGLAAATIVVEAGHRSGALITANHALELGRTVAAVPGPIDTPHAAGSNELLRDGAVVIAGIEDALALVGATRPTRGAPSVDEPDAAAVWAALGRGALDLDALCTHSRLPAARCLAAVTQLELEGRVECAMTGEVRRR